MNPKYPVFVVSKGRWDSRMTSKALEHMHVPYRIVVEQAEYNDYAAVIAADKILVLPQQYLDDYDTCDDIGGERSKGPGAARNFCWDVSINEGFSHHWVMDDNLDAFHRFNKNIKAECESGTIFHIMEEFISRYSNISISGPNYYSFCKSGDKVPAFVLNTRIYSCLLIKNEIPYRWRGRYNEDTDLSLRVLKDGQCTLQFNAFLQGKTTTQRMNGGNSKEFYDDEGTLPKSQMLADLHPDVAEVKWMFNRWHHKVNYKKFKTKLNRIVDVPDRTNNYGMKLIDLKKPEEKEVITNTAPAGGIYLGQRWAQDNSGRVEALHIGPSENCNAWSLSEVTYDPNNSSDVQCKFIATGCAESLLMDAHSTLLRWGVEDGAVTDLGTLIAKRQADQVIIDQAVLELQSA